MGVDTDRYLKNIKEIQDTAKGREKEQTSKILFLKLEYEYTGILLFIIYNELNLLCFFKAIKFFLKP